MAYLKMYGGRIQIGKTIDIYSAAVDTIYYMKNGVAVTVGTTDATGKVTVNKSALPNGTYILYSTVAKDPSNLSSAFSKSVTVRSNTSEIYLMPDGQILYWYGYKPVEFASYASAGYSGMYKFIAPSVTYNTNNILAKVTSVGSSGWQGGVFSTSSKVSRINESKLKSIFSNIGISAAGGYVYIIAYQTQQQVITRDAYTTRNTDVTNWYMEADITTINQAEYYGMEIWSGGQKNAHTDATLNALWLE